MVNNASYENIRQYLKDLDIAYARTLDGDNNLFMLPTDWYAWMPTAHHDNPKVLEYAKKLKNSTYMWAKLQNVHMEWAKAKSIFFMLITDQR